MVFILDMLGRTRKTYRVLPMVFPARSQHLSGWLDRCVA